jgi:hypothetical protein
MLHSRRIQIVAVVALLATPLFLFGDRALAIQDSEDKVWFGPVGITPGERALVNVYSIGNPNEIGNPDERPWNFVVRVFDRRGAVIQEQRLQLPTGAIGLVEVAIQEQENLILAPLSRRTFRAEIVGFNPQPDPPGKWAATLEVVNRLTGRTTLLLGGPDTLPAAQIVPPPGSND